MQQYLLEISFWLCAVLLAQCYFLYPVSLKIIGYFRRYRASLTGKVPGNVSVIIAAYNEEKVIEDTVKRILSSVTPGLKIEIIIGSDKSSDRTNEIVNSLASDDPRIKLFAYSERRGKAPVLTDLVKEASGDVLVFADANTLYHTGSIEKLLKHYADPNVGGVSGRLILRQISAAEKSGSHEKTYWDLETKLKSLEGALGFLIGSNGGIYSIRKELFPAFPSDTPAMDDFYVTMKVLERRKVFVFEADATAEENVAPSVEIEFYRKVRNNALMLFSIGQLNKLLSPGYGLVSYGFWSHKIIRWFTPILLIFALALNILLSGASPFYQVIMYAQAAFYLMGFFGFLLKSAGIRVPVFIMINYFLITNVAMFIGIINFLSGKQKATWQSTARQ